MTGSAATASRRGAAADMEKPSINLAEELARLSAATIFELRGEWRRLHRMPPPMRLSRDLLMRGITYKLQERLRGGLSKSILRKLEGLNLDSETNSSHKPSNWFLPHSPARTSKKRPALLRQASRKRG
jgi:hypothetical protein